MPPRIQLRKTSFLDFPGRISSVFFFPGCNLRCPWCHNRGLITGEEKNLVSLQDALAHLRKRRSVLGGVVLSGGEPCLCGELPLIISEIKKIPLPVKLDTNGTLPVMIEELFSREETSPDYIALDLKIAPARYAELAISSHGGTEAQGDMEGKMKNASHRGTEAQSKGLCYNLIESAALIRKSGITHEFRTLALPGGFISAEDIEALAPLADNAPWYFRPFAGGSCLDPRWDSMEEPVEAARARVEALAGRARELGKRGKVMGSRE